MRIGERLDSGFRRNDEEDSRNDGKDSRNAKGDRWSGGEDCMIAKKTAGLSDERLCSYGRTGLLSLRRSQDIDLFSSTEELISPFSQGLEASLKKGGFAVEGTKRFKSFVELFIRLREDSTAIHIAKDSPFRFKASSESSEFPGLYIDSFIDIATNKILTLFGRAMLRDFLDISRYLFSCERRTPGKGWPKRPRV